MIARQGCRVQRRVAVLADVVDRQPVLEQRFDESLKASVEKYADRVRRGVKTTGWET